MNITTGEITSAAVQLELSGQGAFRFLFALVAPFILSSHLFMFFGGFLFLSKSMNPCNKNCNILKATVTHIYVCVCTEGFYFKESCKRLMEGCLF